jgi:hypothetical protein
MNSKKYLLVCYWSDNCRESIGQNECHGQIVRDDCVTGDEIEKWTCPIGQLQTQEPLGEQNWGTGEEIGDKGVGQMLQK